MRKVITLLSLILLVSLPGVAQDLGSVSGIVLTNDRDPIEGAFVTLRSEDGMGGGHGGGHGGENHMMRTESDEEGRFSFERVEAGDYEISAMAHEVGMIEEELEVVANEETVVELIFNGHGGDDEGIGGVAGRVIDPEEEPIGNAEAILMLDMDDGHGGHRGQHGMFITRSNDDGEFVFDEVPDGEWIIIVGKFGYSPFEDEIEVIENEVTQINITLELQDENVESGSVSGSVFDTEEAPIEFAHVMLMPEAEQEDDHGHHGGHNGRHGWHRPLIAFTDENGEFLLEQVPVGDYEARATKIGHEHGEEDITVRVDENTEINFVLAEGDDHDGDHGGHRGGHGDHNGEAVDLHGWVIIAEDEHMDIYFLDENEDGEEEYILNFGPPDYDPGNDVERPGDGDEVDITGLEVGHMEPAMILVLEINGEQWRDIENDGHGGRHGGGHGWGDHPDQLDMIEADGFSFVTNDAQWWSKYHIDTDDDGEANFRLFFGNENYSPGNGMERPDDEEFIDIIGGAFTPDQGLPIIVVYQVDSNFWRLPGDTLGLFWDENPQGVNGSGELLPNSITLVETYPNPFNPSLTVTVSLANETTLRTKLFNLAGREVYSADLGRKTAGSHQFTILADQLSTGVYLLDVQAEGSNLVRKVTLIK